MMDETGHVIYTCELGILVTFCSLKMFLLVTVVYLRLFMCHIETPVVSLVHL